MEETKLRQLFKNSADAYLNTIDESVEQGMSEDSFIKAVAQAINYTRCCNKLKDKKAMNFEEWVDFEGHRDYYNDLVDNGFAYDIEKFYKRYVEAVKPSL